MAEKLVDVIAKLRQRGKKDQPPKLYVVTMLIFQIKRTIQREKWFNYVITFSFSFFFFNANNFGRSDDARRRNKKGMA